MAENMNISILSGVQGDTRRYRAFHLFEQLRLAGVSTELAHICDAKASDIAARADILILQRVTWDENVDAIITSARKRGSFVIADIDDYIFDPDAFQWIDSPDFKDRTRAGLYRENLLRNRRTIMLSDGVLVSTPFLSRQVEKFGLPVRLHRNGFSLEMYACSLRARANQPARSNQGPVVIGYASGTPTHNRDFALVRPVIEKVLRENPRVIFAYAGHLDPGTEWGPLRERVRRLPFVPWRELPTTLAGFSINLAPLRLDNPFSQSKSEIKYMEAAMVNVPTVASPTNAFQDAIHPGDNGFLAGSERDWERVLTQLVNQPDTVITVGENAYRHVLQSYSPWQRSVEIQKILNSLLDETNCSLPRISLTVPEPVAATDQLHYWSSSKHERRPTLIQRGLYSLKVRGMMTLLKEVWIFFRRAIAPIVPFK